MKKAALKEALAPIAVGKTNNWENLFRGEFNTFPLNLLTLCRKSIKIGFRSDRRCTDCDDRGSLAWHPRVLSNESGDNQTSHWGKRLSRSMHWGRLARRLSGEQIYTKRPKLQRHNSSRELARFCCQISSLDVAKPSDGRICGLVEVCRNDASGYVLSLF